MKRFLIGALILSLPFSSSIVYAQGWPDYWMSPRMMNWGFGLWWFMPFLMMAFWIVVIIGIVSLIRWFSRSDRGRDVKAEDTALDILKKRYARGEISKEDFEAMKKDIS